MAVGNVVPGRRDVCLTLIRCWKCGTLYSTDKTKQIYKTPVYNSARSLGEPVTSYTQWTAYEKCPVCGNETNSDGTVIPAKCFIDGKPYYIHDCLDCVEDVMKGWDDEAQARWEQRAKESGYV